MKTSMAYRLFRLYFNSNSDNHELFGNRVHNPANSMAKRELISDNIIAILRGLAVIAFGLALIASVL